jgi:hypothetical protein
MNREIPVWTEPFHRISPNGVIDTVIQQRVESAVLKEIVSGSRSEPLVVYHAETSPERSMATPLHEWHEWHRIFVGGDKEYRWMRTFELLEETQ